MNFVAFKSIYIYITTYSSSLSQVPQTRLSSQDSVEDPEAERPVSALPGHHSAVFEPSGAWPHPRSNYTFLCFFSILPLMEIHIFIYMRAVEKRQESLHCLFACTVTMQAGQNAKDFFLLKVLVLSYRLGSSVNFAEIN